MASQLTQIKKKRTITYFIEAAKNIIGESGIEGVTIRNVSEAAGYYSASLYNYFENLDELITFAVIDFTYGYRDRLSKIIKENSNSLDVFILTWKNLSESAYANPKIYEYLYSSENTDEITSRFRAYYELFPEKSHGFSDEYMDFVLMPTRYERDHYLLGRCIDDGYFRAEDEKRIMDMSMIMYDGILLQASHRRGGLSAQEYADLFMTYFLDYLSTMLQKDADLSAYGR